MANDLVASGSRELAVAGNPWADAARDVETGTYLKFNGNDGRWSFGQDDDDLPEGSRLVIDMNSLAFGWTCWVEGSVEEEVYVAVVDGRPPAEHTLTDYGPYDDDDGWRESAKVSAVLESYGEDDQDEAVGTALLWKTSTGGQVRQIRKLAGAYGRVFAQHPGEYPNVEINSEGYAPRNKKHGKKKFSPTLKIAGWLTAEELEGLSGVASDDADEPEPAPARSRKAEPVEEEEVAETPARTRRAKPDAEEAPARTRRAAAPVEEEEEVAEAPVRTRRAKPDAEEAPARGRRAAAPVEEEEEVAETPARGRGRRAAAPADDGEAEDDGDGAPAPEPRGRSAARGTNRRLRNFD